MFLTCSDERPSIRNSTRGPKSKKGPRTRAFIVSASSGLSSLLSKARGHVSVLSFVLPGLDDPGVSAWLQAFKLPKRRATSSGGRNRLNVKATSTTLPLMGQLLANCSTPSDRLIALILLLFAFLFRLFQSATFSFTLFRLLEFPFRQSRILYFIQLSGRVNGLE